MSLLVQLLLVLAVALACASVLAADRSAIGWGTIDESTGKARGMVRIIEVSGQYQGRLEKTFPQPGEDPDQGRVEHLFLAEEPERPISPG